MRNRLPYILWLLPGLIVMLFASYYYYGYLNRSERHLGRKLAYFKIADDYRTAQSLAPMIHAWRRPENPAAFKDFFTKGRSYVYQDEKQFQNYLKNFGPAARETYLKALRRVLSSPASKEMKEKAVRGGFYKPLDETFISVPSNFFLRPRNEFCWAEAVDSEEAAFDWWQEETPVLETAKTSGLILDYQHLGFLAVSPDSCTDRYERLKEAADPEILMAAIRKEAKKAGVDWRIFRHAEKVLDNSGYEVKPPLEVAEQFECWKTMGTTNLLQNFLLPQASGSGYWAVIRMSAPTATNKAYYARKLLRLRGESQAPVLICEGALKLAYEEKLGAILNDFFQIWLLGFGVIFLLQTIRHFFVSILVGRGFVPEVMFRYFAPGARAYLVRNGYKTFTHVMTFEEVQRQQEAGLPVPDTMVMRVHEKRGNIRQMVKINLEPGFKSICESGHVYLKRAYGKGMKELRREFINMRRMSRRGLRVPKILGYCEAQWKGYWCGFLMTSNLDGQMPLDYWQTYVAPKLEKAERESVVRRLTWCLAGCLRRAHHYGIFSLQLFGKHIFFNPERPEDGVTLIDVEKARCLSNQGLWILKRFPWLYKGRIKEDLAFLNRYLFWELWPMRERMRLFVNYCRKRQFVGARIPRMTEGSRRLLADVAKKSLKKGYGQYQRVGSVYFNVALYDEMKDILPKTFKEFFAIESDESVTRKKGRTVVRMHCQDRTYYLKRHTGMKAKEALREFLRHGRRMSNGRLEWQAMQVADTLGIPNMPSRAMGEIYSGIREKKSFLLTEALPPGKTVEDHFKAGISLSLQQKIELAKRIAKIARVLHGAGYVHKDFYLGHFYVVGNLTAKDYKIHLLDLQRLAKGVRPLNRWALKDMTALYFSAKPFQQSGQITRTDMLRLYLRYVGHESLDKQDRKFLEKLFLKEVRMASHTEKLLARRRKRGELDNLVK